MLIIAVNPIMSQFMDALWAVSGFSFVVGVVLGLLTGVLLADWWMARRISGAA